MKKESFAKMDDKQITHFAQIISDWIKELPSHTDVPVMAITYCMDELLKKQEAVVRCRDCRHHDDDYPCELHTIDGSAHDDWFCADGVK